MVFCAFPEPAFREGLAADEPRAGAGLLLGGTPEALGPFIGLESKTLLVKGVLASRYLQNGAGELVTCMTWLGRCAVLAGPNWG